MDIKWKNRILFGVIAILFTFSLSGILSFFMYGSNYVHRDYFHTGEFQQEIDRFAGYLTLFELHEMSPQSAKDSITVTEDEIHEHRYRYGTLPEQIANIKSQYEAQIQGALDSENKEAADAFIAERDTKIADITKNFESEEHVKAKIIKEKEKQIDEYFKEIENYRSEYLRLKGNFDYYFKNTVTGKDYSDVNRSDGKSAKTNLNKNDYLYITNYALTKEHMLHYGPVYNDELLNTIYSKSSGTFEGQIAVPKSLSSSNWMMQSYKEYKQKQILLIVFSLISIMTLIFSRSLVKRVKPTLEEMTKWQPYYNKIPVDIRVFIIFITGLIAIISNFIISDQLYQIIQIPFDGFENIILLLFATGLWVLTFIQCKLLIPQLKDWQNVKNEWEKGLFNKALQSLKDAFLNRRVGTQVFLILGFVFCLGFLAIMLAIDGIFLLIYVFIMIVIGLPLFFFIMKKVGYFNKIVQKSNDMAIGHFGQDLPISGKSVLATLARNINTLKHGVKVSQNEQAKSERLKTELITNVSHDLRTPLTSIITYTELLKTENLTAEDKAAYLEIIDRKSKRLKVLIDDLFEVSKMASGNIELKLEKVDLVQLLQQALAEHDNTINESSLQFRTSSSEKPIYALVDGQKLWRVFDNLIGNILKYSLENTRVYINVGTLDEKAIITFKNISKYELNDNIDELFERFKRGDVSRHTDGSGLGLAIAKSIIDLHHGNLDIEVDGDLFKVSISLKQVK